MTRKRGAMALRRWVRRARVVIARAEQRTAARLARAKRTGRTLSRWRRR